MDFLHLITARKEGMTVVTVKTSLVFIVHVLCKGLIQKELLATKFLALRTNNFNIGLRKGNVVMLCAAFTWFIISLVDEV